jgi:hypothetical protein
MAISKSPVIHVRVGGKRDSVQVDHVSIDDDFEIDPGAKMKSVGGGLGRRVNPFEFAVNGFVDEEFGELAGW